MGKKIQGGFLRQIAILAVAGVLVRVIGVLYRKPLTGIIGDLGNGYYGTAYTIYAMILLISSYSIPMAISKVISSRLALKQYKNAQRIFLCALMYVVVVGGMATIATMLLAPVLVREESVLSLRILAPTIFLSGILGVLRGYFQARGTMVQTSVSQIIEQIFNAIVSVLAAYLFTYDYVNTSKSGLVPVYGAAGGALGTSVGVLIALIFMVLVYCLNRPFIQSQINQDNDIYLESYRRIFKIIIFMVTPVILSTFIYNISTSLDMEVYYKIMDIKGMLEKDAYTYYGVYTGKYVVLINIPIALASATVGAMVPRISSSYEQGYLEETKEKVNEAIRFTMMIAIPAAVGLSVLAYPIMELLFPQKKTIELATLLIRIGSVSVVFYALSTITNGVLQSIGKVVVPVKNAAIALILQLVILIMLLFFTDMGIYAMVIVTIIYSLVMCLLNGIAVKKHLGYQQNITKIFILPGIAAGIMGITTWLTNRGIDYVTNHNVMVALTFSIVIAVLIYFIVLIKLKGINEEELHHVPKGIWIIRVAKKMRLL